VLQKEKANEKEREGETEVLYSFFSLRKRKSEQLAAVHIV